MHFLDRIKLDKKSLIYLIILIIVAFLVFGLVYYLIEIQKTKIEELGKTLIPGLDEEAINKRKVEEQLRALDELRKKSGDQPLTKQEIASQLKELDKLRKESGDKPLSEEEIQKQLEELDKLRQSQ